MRKVRAGGRSKWGWVGGGLWSGLEVWSGSLVWRSGAGDDVVGGWLGGWRAPDGKAGGVFYRFGLGSDRSSIECKKR